MCLSLGNLLLSPINGNKSAILGPIDGRIKNAIRYQSH